MRHSHLRDEFRSAASASEDLRFGRYRQCIDDERAFVIDPSRMDGTCVHAENEECLAPAFHLSYWLDGLAKGKG